MKKFPLLALFLLVLSACNLDPVRDVWEYYEDWRNENNAWLAQQEARTNADGTPYYQKVVPEFDRNAYVLIHYFTDRSATEGNLSPLISSTVDVKYKLLTCRGVGVASTYLLTSPADSVYRSVLSANITGFQIALMAMNVGDSCEVVIPYQQAYSNSGKGTILPYSHLHYFLKLKDIYKYQKK